jgi:hypothetical protein
VAMQLDALNRCDSLNELTAQLGHLPPDLHQTYQQIFARIDSHHYGNVLTILQWLAFSKEPLTLDQICEVVAIVFHEDKQPTFEPGRKWNRQSVKRICANLVTVMDDGKVFSKT